MQKLEVHIGNVEARLETWRAKIEELVAKGDLAGATAKVGYRERVEQLRAKHSAAHSKLDELKAAGRQKWQRLGTDLERACREIEVAFRRVTVREKRGV